MARATLTLKFIAVFLGLMTGGVALKTGVYALFGGGSGWLGFLASTAIAGGVSDIRALVNAPKITPSPKKKTP